MPIVRGRTIGIVRAVTQRTNRENEAVNETELRKLVNMLRTRKGSTLSVGEVADAYDLPRQTVIAAFDRLVADGVLSVSYHKRLRYNVYRAA